MVVAPGYCASFVTIYNQLQATINSSAIEESIVRVGCGMLDVRTSTVRGRNYVQQVFLGIAYREVIKSQSWNEGRAAESCTYHRAA